MGSKIKGFTVTNFKEEVKEIVEILALVPEPHKAMCFEILLKEALSNRRTPTISLQAQPAAKPMTVEPIALTADPVDSAAPSLNGIQPKVNNGSDIAISDLHMKTKKILGKVRSYPCAVERAVLQKR